MIPISKPDIGPAEEQAVLDVLRSGMLAMGRRTAEFEEAWAAYCGVRHAVFMSNGTVALEAVLRALGIGPGDEVITVSFTFNATVSAILQAGARPVFVDIRAAGLLHGSRSASRRPITPRTKAIMPVHLYGLMADMDPLVEIARAARDPHRRGRRPGPRRDVPRTTRRAVRAGDVQPVRDQEPDDRRGRLRDDRRRRARRPDPPLPQPRDARALPPRGAGHPTSSRPTSRPRSAWPSSRGSTSGPSSADGTPLASPTGLAGYLTPAGPRRPRARLAPVHDALPRRAGRASIDGLTERGVGTLIYYPIPVHRQAYLQAFVPGAADLDLPVTNRLADEVLSIPVRPNLDPDELEAVIAAIREVATPVGRPRSSRPRAPEVPPDDRAPLRVGLAGLGSMGRNHLRHLSSREDCVLAAVADPDPGVLADAVAKTGAAGFADPLAMIERGRDRGGRHRRSHDGALAPRARGHRARPAGPRREAARGDGRGGDRARGGGPGPRRSAPGRPRGALQPGRPRARPAPREGLGRDAVLDHEPPRRAVPGPDPRRRRDHRPRHPRRRHPLVGRRRAADAGLRRDRPAAARHATRTCCSGCSTFPSGATGMLDVNWLTPAKRRQLTVVGEAGMFELDYLTQRLTFTSADVGSPTIIDGYATTFEGNVVVIDVASREPLAAELDAFLAVARDGGRPVVDGEDGLWALAIASGLLQAAAEGPPGRPGRIRRDRWPPDDDHRPVPRPRPAVLGGTITLPQNPCLHAEARPCQPWTGEPGTAGTVTVVGAGKMGLPLAAQFASHGWSVIAVDVNEAVVAAINEGRAHVAEEPGLAERVAEAHAAGPPPGDDRRRRRSPGVGRRRPDRAGHARRRAAARLPPHGCRRRRDRARRPRRHDRHLRDHPPGRATRATGTRRSSRRRAGLVADRDLFVAFSPERLFTGAVFRNLATYPKLVGGIGPASTERAARFYASVLDAEVVAMSSAEAAELSKLADTTYRDVNIAFANELAALRRPDRRGRPRGDPGREQPAVQPHPPARPRRGRPLHPGLPALPPVAGPGDGAGRSSRGG